MAPRRFLVLVLAILISTLAMPAFAQTGAVIAGTASDAQGGVLPGVTLTVRNADSGLVRTLATEADGKYRFAGLPPGRYDLTAELAGFGTVQVKDLTLTVGLELTRNVTLSVAGVQENVTVTGEAPIVEPTKSEVAGVITQNQIETLPISSRQTINLALLMPGTSQDATRTFKINATVGSGGTWYSNTYIVDGAANQEIQALEPRQNFPQAAIREFKVNLSQAEAQYGGGTGGVVTIVTKSGTNTVGGEAFEFFRDKSLNAMNKFEKLQHDQLGLPKPAFRRNQYGVSLGGPVVKDRVHYFAAIDRTNAHQNDVVFTGKPQFYSSVEGAFPSPVWRYQYFTRLDAQLNQKQTLFIRWALEHDHITCTACGATGAATSSNAVEQRRHSLVAGHTSVLSSRMLNEALFQWAPFTFLNEPPSTTALWDSIGEFPPARTSRFSSVYVLPSLAYGSNSTFVQHEIWWQAKDDFSITADWLGSHAWKFGADFKYIPVPGDGIGAPGTWTFASDQLFNPADPSTIARLTSPILFVQNLGPAFNFTQRNRWFGAYVQDEWKPRSNLTFNLGLRYDLQKGAMNEHLDLSQFPTPLPYVDPKSRGDNNNFAPRLGVAWDLAGNGKTVVRGGYGIYYRYLGSGQARSEIQNLKLLTLVIRNPSYPDPYQGQNPLTFAAATPQNITIFANNMQNPMARVANAGVSQELTNTLAVHIDVLDTRTSHEALIEDINAVNPATGLKPLAQWGRIDQIQPMGRATYRALLARFEKRLERRYQYLISYTLAKMQDNNFTQRVTDPGNPGLDFGPSSADRRQSLVASGALVMPGNVTLGAVWTRRSGLPFSARAGVDLNRDGFVTDYVPGTSRNQGNRDLDLSLVNAWRALNGRAPISASQFDSSRYSSLDMRVSKMFSLGSTRKIEAIAQVFNMLGTDNLGLPFLSGGGTVQARVENALSDSFGRLLAAQNRQQAELALRLIW